jgi:hypothetical protein
MPHKVVAFAGREEVKRDRDQLEHLLVAAGSRRPQKRFQLREGEFDRIEIGTVGREKAKARPDAFDGGLDLWLFVHREIVEDDDVAGPERRHQRLLDVCQKAGIVDRPIEDHRRMDAISAKRRDECVHLPMATRRVIAQPHPSRAAAISTEQVRRDAGFVNEDIAARVVQRQRVLPASARGRHISAPLFVGVYRFF